MKHFNEPDKENYDGELKICEDIETFKIKLPEDEEFKRPEALLNAL